jgi:hypothetical protein
MDTLTILYVFGLVAAFYMGQHWAMFKFMQKILKNPNQMLELVQRLKQLHDEGVEDEADLSVEIEIETVSGQVYAYEKKTGNFLAQAQSLQQIMDTIALRYPHKKFWHPSLKKDNQSA